MEYEADWGGGVIEDEWLLLLFKVDDWDDEETEEDDAPLAPLEVRVEVTAEFVDVVNGFVKSKLGGDVEEVEDEEVVEDDARGPLLLLLFSRSFFILLLLLLNVFVNVLLSSFDLLFVFKFEFVFVPPFLIVFVQFCKLLLELLVRDWFSFEIGVGVVDDELGITLKAEKKLIIKFQTF